MINWNYRIGTKLTAMPDGQTIETSHVMECYYRDGKPVNYAIVDALNDWEN